jgi:hypothetical protein
MHIRGRELIVRGEESKREERERGERREERGKRGRERGEGREGEIKTKLGGREGEYIVGNRE